VATEININDILEANEKQQKEILDKRKKELNAIKTEKLRADQKKQVEDAKKQVAFLESNIKKAVAAINKRRQQFGPGQPVDDLVQNLTNVVNSYNSAVQNLNKVTPPTRTGAMGGVPGAGRNVQPTTPAGTVTPTGPTGPDAPQQVTATATATATAAAGIGAGAGAGTKTPKAPKTSAAKTTKEKQELGRDAVIQAGINQAVVQYMKENYPNDWAEIKKLRDLAIQNGVIEPNELTRIANAFKNTTYWKNAAVENNRTAIGAYLIANGLDSISNAGLIDKLTEDVYVTGVMTLQQAQAQIRRDAVAKLGLTGPDADPSKIKIAQAMIDGGQTFMTAAGDYIDFYTKTTDTPLNEFDPFEDKGFLSAFTQSKSLTDFAQKIKATPTYVNSDKGRREINGVKLQLQQLTRGLGLGYNPEQLEQQAVNIASGRETFQQLEFSLRSIAGEAFPMFKDRILAGETVSQIASPYVSSMSRILEIPDSAIDLSDPSNEIRKALIGDGKVAKPLWQFEQELFKDARWQFTSNARDTMDRVSMDILQRFGVMG
jgi:hypothetical protein